MNITMMLYQDVPLAEREKMLQNLAVSTEKKQYSRTLTQAEVDRENVKYSSDAIQRDSIKEQAKKAADDYKTQVATLETKMEETLGRIKNRKLSITGNLYGIINHEHGIVVFYDKHGEFIEHRNLLPHEKQGSLFIPENATPPKEGETGWEEFEKRKQEELAAHNQGKNNAKEAKPKGKGPKTTAEAPKAEDGAAGGEIVKEETPPAVEVAKTQLEIQNENANKNRRKPKN